VDLFSQIKGSSSRKIQNIYKHDRKPNRRKILTLRSYRGGEYLSEAFSEYLHDQGIVRHLTAACTPS
jgi:hypothetical protein